MPLKMEPGIEIEEIFCGSRVRFYDQPIGVIVAESSQIANRAAEHVKVSYQQRGMSTIFILLLTI
jgi:CO/xanthine dehydrogenase Mo-binding subunit